EVMLMITPWRCFIIARVTARVSAKAPRRLASSWRSQSWSLIRITRPSIAIPALFTRTSIRPWSAITFSTAWLAAELSATSNRIALPLAPAPATSCSVSSAAAWLDAYPMTPAAPRSRTAGARARPMPREPPVISATLPPNSPTGLGSIEKVLQALFVLHIPDGEQSRNPLHQSRQHLARPDLDHGLDASALDL